MRDYYVGMLNRHFLLIVVQCCDYDAIDVDEVLFPHEDNTVVDVAAADAVGSWTYIDHDFDYDHVVVQHLVYYCSIYVVDCL